MENIVITCIQCQEDFDFSIKEQKKLKKKGFDAPLRCPHCRKNKSRHFQHNENRWGKSKKRNYRIKLDEDDE